MIDSHCHLTDLRLESQLEDVLARAVAAGVSHMVTIGVDPADAFAAILLCERFPDRLRCAIGIHPNHCAAGEFSAIDRIRELAARPAVVALGEMGLDYFHKLADRTRQRQFFERQLILAAELNKPAVLHCREAVGDALAILKDHPAVRCVFHCFTGTPAEAEQIVAAGHYVGFTGAVTFKNNEFLREAARLVPAERILVETDAPYLSPEPVRKIKTCEPGFVCHTLAAVAAARGVSIQAMDERTTRNTASFYAWSPDFSADIGTGRR